MKTLKFIYSSMNAGKTTQLLQTNFNFIERGMRPIVFNAKIDNRFSDSGEHVHSRIGLCCPSIPFDDKTDLYSTLLEKLKDGDGPVHCVLVDEAQFLTKRQVKMLTRICDTLNIDVTAYGLRTDFSGELFDGSATLMALADEITEIKGVCFCSKPATMVLRVDGSGYAITSGEQINIGSEEKYVSVCRFHHKQGYEDGVKVPLNIPSRDVNEKIKSSK